jgi:hypothetical protein
MPAGRVSAIRAGSTPTEALVIPTLWSALWVDLLTSPKSRKKINAPLKRIILSWAPVDGIDKVERDNSEQNGILVIHKQANQCTVQNIVTT